MNNAPLLATLGVKGNPATAAMPEGTLGDALSTDDRALDAALEFASLLLQSGANGKALPEGGNPLPLVAVEALEPGVLEEAALIAQDLAADEALEQAVIVTTTVPAVVEGQAESAQLGRQVAGDIRRAKAAAAERILPAIEAKLPPAATTEPARTPPAQMQPTQLPLAQPLEREIIAKLGTADRGVVITQDVQAPPGAMLRSLAPLLPGNLQETSALAPRTMSLDVPMGDQDWGRQFSERVGWVIHARVPNAQLRLNPEHLGPIEMSIEVDDQNARVQFVAAHGATRDAIEQSLPRLREMLEQQGLNLEHAGVGAQGGNTSDGGEQSLSDEPATPLDDSASELADGSADTMKPRINHSVGLIDTFV